jgi:hypothetical protein
MTTIILSSPFFLSESDIDKLMNELESKRDSFSTSHIIDLFDNDIDFAERSSNLVMYIIHRSITPYSFIKPSL